MPATVLLPLSLAALLGLGLLAAAILKAWRNWLELKRLELACRPAAPSTLSRAEMLELRERVRRLEAIADGEV